MILTLGLAAALTSIPTDAPYRGMTISCPIYGEIWGSPQMEAAVKEIAALGIDSVAIHPYARIERSGRISGSSPQKTAYLERAVTFVRKEKHRLFWKPHLAYWGSFEWRGSITFSTEAEWARFFRDYKTFIVAHARFAAQHKAELFAVGVELDKTVHRKEWFSIIRAVREQYSGKITYAANWDSVERVPFWGSLDYVGVQAYFPVSTKAYPKRADVENHWDRHLVELKRIAAAENRPILFTEIGYNPSAHAAQRPWDPKMGGGTKGAALRSMLTDVALKKVEGLAYMGGVFWWKWIPGSTRNDPDFNMKSAGVRSLLRKHYNSFPTPVP